MNLTLDQQEALQRIRKPFVRYPNTNDGYNKATEDFQELMEWTLGTDCGQELNDRLDQKRWAMKDYYKNLHDWEIL